MILEVHGLSKRLGTRAVLERLELECAPSELVLIGGENGSGKTTLLRVLAGILAPSRGSVQICGHSLERAPSLAKACLGYVPDSLDALPELLVSELLGLVAALKSRARRAPAPIDAVWKQRLAVDAVWGQRLRSLSFGQRKRVALLAALIGEPELLLLDEPTNGLDAAGIELVFALLEERRQAARATLVTSHDPELSRRLPATCYRLASARLSRVRCPTDGAL